MSDLTSPFVLQHPDLKADPAFVGFYDLYAPILWNLLLSTHLAQREAETILVNTFIKAGQHPNWLSTSATHPLSWLLRLAYSQGLPVAALRPTLKERRS